MSGTSGVDRTLSLRVRAEAAAWLAGLRGPNRTSELDGRFKRWLAASETNRAAWERQSEAWELAEGLAGRFESSRRRLAPKPRGGRQPRTIVAICAVLSAAVVALLLAWLIFVKSGVIVTSTGEQRVMVLPDGSRITLNTDTRIIVQYGRTRRVRLDRGEALFDVTPEHDRPFIVVAGAHAIRAVGTAFDVRRDALGKLSITLIEGRVSIASSTYQERRSLTSNGRRPDVTILAAPGERATFTPHHEPTLDRPVLQRVIAWQSGEVVFDSTPLPEAVSEMNRYSERRIVLKGSGMDALHVGGLFQAGESVAFARAIAETFDLDMREEGESITLSRRNVSSPSPHPGAGSQQR